MKIFNKKWWLITVISAIVITACDKKDLLTFHQNGAATVTLTASKTSVAPAPADSANPVISFSWTSPKYEQDTSLYKFILEIDSTGRNFAKKTTRIVNGTLNMSFTGLQLNNMLSDFGFTPGQSFSFDIRMVSSYGNNNEQIKSNVIKVDIKSYLVPITLVPSSSSPLVLLVSNASNPAVSFNWNASNFGSNTISYALQIDTAGGNFTNPQVKKLGTNYTSGFTVNELNSIAIAAGVIGGSTKNVQFRVVSYLGNYTTLMVISNVVTISVTTFTPIPPTLYIVGDATAGGWSNPVPLPSQQFTRLDAVSYGIVINLTAGKSYVFLPLNGDWGHKYGGTSATGGTLLADGAVPGSNTPAPATTGNYQIVVNFQTGTYAVTPFSTTIPPNLYIVGDATPGGWNNPVPVPSQQFTRIDAVTYGIVINLTAGKSYVFLPLNGDWGHKYGGTSATGGTLLADGAVPGSNTPAPATTGNYQILVNFQTGTYTVTPYTGTIPVPNNLYIVGDATAGGWNNPVPVPAQQFTQINLTQFQIILPLTAGKSYVFLPLNGDWTHKFGGTSATGGALLADGAVPGSNTPAPAASGTYKIVVDFSLNTYTVTLQ
jgi:starch-binding outer membrane protein SusE/F